MQAFRAKGLQEVLAELDTESSASAVQEWQPAAQTNLSRKMALGLKSLYSEISAARNFGGEHLSFSKGVDLRNVPMQVSSKALPMIGKRYKLVKLIGDGTFSQIFQAVDSFFGRDVAIKVVLREYNELGLRESRLLQYFSGKTATGSKHCK
jgi:serine/threonine protein kinase